MTAIITGHPEDIARALIALKHMPLKVTVRPPREKVLVSADGQFRIGDWVVYDWDESAARQVAHITKHGTYLQAHDRWPIGSVSHVRHATPAEIAQAQAPKPDYWARIGYPDGWHFRGDDE